MITIPLGPDGLPKSLGGVVVWKTFTHLFEILQDSFLLALLRCDMLMSSAMERLDSK